MKSLIAAASLVMLTSTAMAAAPCENPVVPACQKACAAMGAKLVLSMRGQSVQQVRSGGTNDVGSPDSARRLARLSGLSLDYIDGLTLRQIGDAVAASCPR